jgi:hypothetical protein
VAVTEITLDATAAAALMAGKEWWTLAALRPLVAGASAHVLAHDFGPDPARPEYAFLGCDMTPKGGPPRLLRRFVVVLRERAVVSFDMVALADKRDTAAWKLTGSAPNLAHRSLLPRPGQGDEDGDERLFLNILAANPQDVQAIRTLDLAGVRIGQDVVLFHADSSMARTSVFFDVAPAGRYRILVAGLAPGGWDVWWNGYLETTGGVVRPTAGTLRFSGDAGGYYLRRRD